MKIALVTLLYFLFADVPDFLIQQKRHPRVKEAYKTKEAGLTERLQKAGLTLDNLHILIIAYKQNALLDIYAKAKEDTAYQKISTYRICALSGHLGPKRRQGDRQVPEGFYHITHFNPDSKYHLSMIINYPNESDRLKSKAAHLGGNICIHGNCVTIGCLPMTDDKIKEIYLYAIQARQCGQEKIPVYIFPFKFTDKKMEEYKNIYKKYPETIRFWQSLREGHDLFINELKEPCVTIDSRGNYLF